MSLSEQADPRNHRERRYPQKQSLVKVYYRETGEMKEFPINAGPAISPFLCEQSRNTGFLTLMNGDSAVNIPVDLVERWEIEVVSVVEEDR